MSSRTKSFFDQNHASKHKTASWPRSRPDRPALTETTNIIAQPKAPIPANTQAKSKLKAFQFVPGQPGAARAGNENEGLGGGLATTAERPGVPAVKPVDTALSTMEQQEPLQADMSTEAAVVTAPTPQSPRVMMFPSTPAARLTLDDLIGNIDGAQRDSRKDQSPEEILGWNPNNATSAATPSRKRERAKSSSPSCPTTSSQRRENALLQLSAAGKTPAQADPAAELWQRYGAVDKDRCDLPKPSEVSFAFQASPRSLETPAKTAGLRRWASTGNDWPSSRTKKRRTNGTASRVSLYHNDQVNAARQSKVAAMVEKIQESLATQQLDRRNGTNGASDGPSSSSPLPEVGAMSNQARDSSMERQAEAEALPHHGAKTAIPETATTSTIRGQLASVAESEARGGESVEINHVLPSQRQLDPTTDAPLHLQSRRPMPAFKRPSISRKTSSNPPQPAPDLKVQISLPLPEEDLEEFANDLSAEDFNDVPSQVQMPQAPLIGEPAHAERSLQTLVNVERKSHPHPLIAVDLSGFEDDDDEDEFGEYDLDDQSFLEAEIHATQALNERASLSYKKQSRYRRTSPRKSRHGPPSSGALPSPLVSSQISSQHNEARYWRFRIKKNVEAKHSNAQSQPERILLVEDERHQRPIAIMLRGSWTHTAVAEGDIIHVSKAPQAEPAPPLAPGQLLLDDSNTSPLLIVHPDHMISATTVADSFDCVRKAVLQDRIKATGETSKSMVYGKILHEVFQQSLIANCWGETFLFDLVEKTVQAHIEGLWELGMRDDVLAIEEVKAKMGELAAWAKVFIGEMPGANAKVASARGESLHMALFGLVAIEEHVWSPMFGLKGNVDATVQAVFGGTPLKKVLAPFEVKTGRTTNAPAHHAQTALYTLLMSDRYEVDVKAGVLYYLESSNISHVAPSVTEIRQMMQQRNRLASYIHRARYPRVGHDENADTSVASQSQVTEQSGLPAMMKNPFKCAKCYARQSCFTLHALAEDGAAESAGMIDDGKKDHSLVWQEAVGHLLPSKKKMVSDEDWKRSNVLKQWFTRWERLLTFEESETSRIRKELWTMPSKEREDVGRCFGDLVIRQDLTSTAAAVTSTIVDGIEGRGGRINKFAYSFERATDRKGRPFNDGSQLTLGEPVVVSSEAGQWALANGYVIAVSKQSITVAVDRKLGNARQRLPGFDAESNQSLRGIMSVGRNADSVAAVAEERTLYRLDKDEFSNGLALVRNNLMTFMSSHPVHTKLRDLIIFDRKPAFATAASVPALPASQLGEMNEDQKAAVGKVISAQDYALILGMPGTGKTTTIAHLIRALLADGQSILLTSFTHTAVDNILLKIRDVAPADSVLRLGVPAKINPQVQHFCQLAATPRKSVAEIEQAYMGSQIVATTCMGTNHALFNRRVFDVCIVDEASQTTLPTSLGPLLSARKFILVGDHFQLPPLIQNRRALEGGLDVSLFRMLSERQPDAIAMLGKQYRMCEEIMSLSNALIYEGRLRCGNEAVANRTMHLSQPDGLAKFHSVDTHCRYGGRCWLHEITNAGRKVLFANTDPLGDAARETLVNSSKNITNRLEAALTVQIVTSLLALGLPARDIGVITLYRSQIALLRQLFSAASICPDVEIDSADRFQGRDKECVIISMVRSNESGTVGDLIKDWRRLNVAFTRARSKLIVLGGRRTLRNNDLMARFLDLVDGRGWSMDLPRDAQTSHSLGFGSQATGKTTSVEGPLRLSQSPRKLEHVSNKSIASSPVMALAESNSAGNRSAATWVGRQVAAKKPGKAINGREGPEFAKTRKSKEQIAIEIFEDLTAEDWS